MEFTNNGKVISYLKTIKGGHLVSRLFEIHRHSIQLAFLQQRQHSKVLEQWIEH